MTNNFGLYPSLMGSRAFVTGGATGIGAAIVRAFVRQGTSVGFVDTNADAGHELAGELAGAGGTCWFRTVDVTDVAALQAAVSGFETEVGPVETLVNNVANDARHGWRELDLAAWEAALAVNLRPAVFAIQAVAPGMLDRGRGSIVNFGSIAWKVKHNGMPAYTIAKAAVHGITRSFVQEFGAAGVRINTVLPGWVLTEKQIREYYDAEGQDYLRRNQPLKGTIGPEDAAALVMYLAARDSAMCTGQEFTIDGGWT